MKIAVYSAKTYDREFLTAANQQIHHELCFIESHLNLETLPLSDGMDAICVFSNDRLDRTLIRHLAQAGKKVIALRCAGYNNIDLEAAEDFGVPIVHVPAYSPYAIAEYTVGMMLTLNRKFHKSYNRVREGNFTLNGLMGFDLHGKTVGIVGTGRIGQILSQILKGFGCRMLAFDPVPSISYEEHGVHYVSLPELMRESDIITLHCPLTPHTHHLIDEAALSQTRRGVMIINTSRGGVLDTKAVIKALKSGQIGYLGMDVYESEADIFFEDFSATGIDDDLLARLLTFPNVLVTSHQAFFTWEAMHNIALTTLQNIADIEKGLPCKNLVISVA